MRNRHRRHAEAAREAAATQYGAEFADEGGEGVAAVVAAEPYVSADDDSEEDLEQAWASTWKQIGGSG